MAEAAPSHQIWGEAEVLSCYSASDVTRSVRSRPERKLPREIRQHISSNVTIKKSPCSESGSESQPAGGQAAQSSGAGLQQPNSDADAGALDLGDLPSLGSKGHATSECKPCLYMSTKTGCFNGERCTFCHFQHTKKNRPRPCKATRLQCKQIASMLDVIVADPQQVLDSMQKLGTKSPSCSYMRNVLKSKMPSDAKSSTDNDPGEGEKNENGDEPHE